MNEKNPAEEDDSADDLRSLLSDDPTLAKLPVRVNFRGRLSIKGCEVFANKVRMGQIMFDPDSSLRWVLSIDGVVWPDGLPEPAFCSEGPNCVRTITELSAKRLAYSAFDPWYRALHEKNKKDDSSGEGDQEVPA